MQFKILNNKLLQMMRPGVSMFNSNIYNEIIVYPIVKISSVKLCDKSIIIQLDSAAEDKLLYESTVDAHRAFDILVDALAGKKAVQEHASYFNEGPSPDLWAIEQLK